MIRYMLVRYDDDWANVQDEPIIMGSVFSHREINTIHRAIARDIKRKKKGKGESNEQRKEYLRNIVKKVGRLRDKDKGESR